MSEMWRERYGEMVPEKILDTKIGPDGRRYYKVQWAATTMERGNNFLEAELLIKKYWDPVQKKLVLPSMRTSETAGGDEGQSSSTQCKDGGDKLSIVSQSFDTEEAPPAQSMTENTSEFVAADVSDERTETSDKSDNTGDTDASSMMDKDIEESLQTNEEREEQSNFKRKRSGLTERDIENSSDECEIATKRTKDNIEDFATVTSKS